MSTTPETTPPTTTDHGFTNEEIVFLIKSMWAALRSPGWTFKNRKDLEKIGEAIFSGKELNELDDALYDRIFPHLKTVAIHLGKTLRDSSPDVPKNAPEENPKETKLTNAPTEESAKKPTEEGA